MTMIRSRIFIWASVFLLLATCRQRYNSPVRTPAAGLLVVEGFINCGGDSTVFRLTRSVKLDSSFIKPELSARLLIEAKSGNTAGQLTEISPGVYSGRPSVGNFSDQYRLHIFTADGSEYASDWVSPKKSPPIDTVSWQGADGGINILVSSHDPTDQTIYYKWAYDDAWKYRVPNISELEYVNGSLQNRQPDHEYYECYQTGSSSSILVASTEKFSSDIISNYPIYFIPYGTTERLAIRYSILVKQTALSQEAFNFFTKLEKNTEQLGSIFDAQPADLTGNIHSVTHPEETVVGELYCSSVTTKRIYINRADLPPASVYTGYEGCTEDSLDTRFLNYEFTFGTGDEIPIVYVFTLPRPKIVVSTPYCADCRLRGGTLLPPDFWHD